MWFFCPFPVLSAGVETSSYGPFFPKALPGASLSTQCMRAYPQSKATGCDFVLSLKVGSLGPGNPRSLWVQESLSGVLVTVVASSFHPFH